MAETFVLMDDNKTLGSLLQPPVGNIDVILTNPPYVTRGSAIYKETIRNLSGQRNGQNLQAYYDRAGLGVEALFMRYISGALKPGGRAFVIVPQGLLNRTEPGPKQQLLDECNLLASIQLPRNTFFNTAQKTYILVLEKRHSPVDPRPDVLCGLARSIGESLDWRRIPTPDANDLADIAEAFVALHNGDTSPATDSPVVKLASASEFGKDDRWDIVRFWSDDELVELGETTSPVDRLSFIEDARATLEELTVDLEEARSEVERLRAGSMREVSLSDLDIFTVRSGNRITTRQIQDNPGDIPVFSCFREPSITKGSVSEKWLLAQKKRSRGSARGASPTDPVFPIEAAPSVTVNANGASVGKVFVRPAGCLLTDDVIIVQPVDGVAIDLDYLSVALQSAVTAGGFLYEAKLFTTRLKTLTVEVPVDNEDRFDLDQQKRIASADKRLRAIISRLDELGRWSAEARIV